MWFLNSSSQRQGRCDTYATEFDLEAEEYVPLPKGDVHKKKEIIQDVTLHDLDVANARPQVFNYTDRSIQTFRFVKKRKSCFCRIGSSPAKAPTKERREETVDSALQPSVPPPTLLQRLSHNPPEQIFRGQMGLQGKGILSARIEWNFPRKKSGPIH